VVARLQAGRVLQPVSRQRVRRLVLGPLAVLVVGTDVLGSQLRMRMCKGGLFVSGVASLHVLRAGKRRRTTPKQALSHKNTHTHTHTHGAL
jgi:hypothetical protein